MEQALTKSARPSTESRLPLPIHTRTLWAVLAAAAVMWALAQAGLFQHALINPGGWPLVAQFLQASLRPDLSPKFLGLTLTASLTTLAYAVCGTFLSLLLGLVGGVLTSEVWWQSVWPVGTYRAPWFAMRAGLVIPRAIHEVIWGLFFVNILGLNPLAAILAIAISFGAITAKVFADVLDETPRAPFKALIDSGVGPLSAFLYGLIPQALPNMLSYAFYRFECSIRAAAVLGVIGAGGLGYEILLSFQSLRYEQIWTLLFAVIMLSGLVDYWSGLVRHRLRSGIKPVDNDAGLGCASQCAPPVPHHDPVLTASFITLLALVPFAFWYVRADFATLFAARTARLFMHLVADSFPPPLGSPLLKTLWTGSLQTLALSILAIAIASVGGLLFSFLAASNFLPRQPWGVGLRFLARAVLLISRAIPASVWALIVLLVLFPGILPGAVALGLYSFGILGRLMAEVAENLSDRPQRALKDLGASGMQVFFYGTVPSALPNFVSYVLYRWEVCSRETVVVGVVGAAGLGRVLSEQLSNFDYRSVFTTLLFFIGLTMVVDLISATARRALR